MLRESDQAKSADKDSKDTIVEGEDGVMLKAILRPSSKSIVVMSAMVQRADMYLEAKVALRERQPLGI